MGWITGFEAQELIAVALDLGQHPGAVRAECVARCPLGIVMPVPALVCGANRRRAGLKDGGDLILTVPGAPRGRRTLRAQSRSNSLIEVLDRVCASTFFTITAQ